MSCRPTGEPGMITASTAETAGIQLTSMLSARNKPASGQGPDRVLGQLAEAVLATEAGIGLSDMKKVTGISIRTSQLIKTKQADKVPMSRSHAELSILTHSVTVTVRSAGITLGMADQIEIKIMPDMIALATQAGIAVTVTGHTAETLLIVNAEGMNSMTVPFLKVNSLAQKQF